MKRLFFCSVFFLWSGLAFSATATLNSTQYSHGIDTDLTIRTMSYLPSKDNVRGIYAKDVDKKLREHIEKNHHWEYSPAPMIQSIVEPESLVGKPNLVKTFSKDMKSDAFFSAETRKDPAGLELVLFLFSTKSGRLIAEERRKNVADNTPGVLQALDTMVTSIRKKIPYEGLILSRIDNRVTVNLGQKDGLVAGQELPVLQIVGIKRHPQRDFVIQSDKLVLGKIRIVKVDKYLSFADVTSESERGVVAKGTKVAGAEAISNPETLWTQTYTPPEVLLSEDNQKIYGTRSQEWVPETPATFGKIGARIGVGHMNNNYSLDTGVNYEAVVPAYPKIDLEAEIWLSPDWFLGATISQGLAASANPVGSSSSTLNSTLSQYRIMAGYNFLVTDDFFGPKLMVELGVSYYRMFIDQTSPPTFSSLSYTSVPFGIGGYVPVSRDKKWGIGGNAYFHMFPSLEEDPFSGGSSNNTINHILFYGLYKWSQRLQVKFGLESLILSTEFSGRGNRPDGAGQNMSQRHITGLLGCEYLF